MKKTLFLSIATFIASLFTVSALASNATGQRNEEVVVTSSEEFVNAIGSNRTIVIITEYINITEVISEMNGLYSESAEDETRTVFWVGETDGPEFHIKGVDNLTIKAGVPVVSIVCDPRYANVISFSNCRNVSLEGITFGHTEPGYCSQGVLGFYNCMGFKLDRCDLFGCGTEAVMVYQCSDMKFTATKMRDCSYHIMHIQDSQEVTFDGCQFFRNREYDQLNIYSSVDVVFRNCMFANNTGILFNVTCPVVMEDCVILHDSDFLGNMESIEMVNCVMEEYFNSEQALG